MTVGQHKGATKRFFGGFVWGMALGIPLGIGASVAFHMLGSEDHSSEKQSRGEEPREGLGGERQVLYDNQPPPRETGASESFADFLSSAIVRREGEWITMEQVRRAWAAVQGVSAGDEIIGGIRKRDFAARFRAHFNAPRGARGRVDGRVQFRWEGYALRDAEIAGIGAARMRQDDIRAGEGAI